ncbi:MAG: hypothetical protein IJU37_00735 [Desulfovibrio sp.]|nr:hypothetical protein [Desulfovibrio sp.]
MTLESSLSKAVFYGNNTATEFPFTFKVWKKSQIHVTLADASGVISDVSADASIVLNEDAGGIVTYAPGGIPLPSGTTLAITRDMPFLQRVDLVSATRFDPQVIEDALDTACAERQELREKLDRAVLMPVTFDESSEGYAERFWSAYHDVEQAHAEVMAERPKIIAEGEKQILRVQNAADSYYTELGNGCMEMAWTIYEDIPAGIDIDIDPLWYIVGRHHIQVSVNGVRQYSTMQFNEKGADGTKSHVFTMLVNLHAGDSINVWISHLSGAGTATPEADGLMSAADKAKLNGIAEGANKYVHPTHTAKASGLYKVTVDSSGHVSNTATVAKSDITALGIPAQDTTYAFARTTTTLSAALPANTAFTVPQHQGGLLLVLHNGVLCEAGTSGQYVDISTTSIKFTYAIPKGDTITAVAVT